MIGFLFSPVGRALALALALLGSHGWAFHKGETSAANRALVASLQARLAEKEIDLQAARSVAEASQRAAAEAAAAAQDNAKRLEGLRHDNKGEPGSRPLTADRARRLRDIR